MARPKKLENDEAKSVAGEDISSAPKLDQKEKSVVKKDDTMCSHKKFDKFKKSIGEKHD